MSSLRKNWKILLAVILLLAAVLVFFLLYRPAEAKFKTDVASVANSILVWQTSIAETQAKITANKAAVEQFRPYEDVQDKLEAEYEAIDLSRSNLYEKFPAELREEDQILYILYLEQQFGTEIMFEFSQAQPVYLLSDGAILGGTSLIVNYETTYQGFKDMVTYLATDDRITSIRNAVVSYDKENDKLIGNLTVLCYVLQPDAYDPSEYVEPEVEVPDETGKQVIFH